jgi:hypothetical protein
MTIINYCIIIIIINAYYTSVINAQCTYCIANEGFLKQQNKGVTVLLLPFPVTKADCKTFCPMSRFRPVTTRPTPQ